MAPKRSAKLDEPPPASSDDKKDGHLIDGPENEEEQEQPADSESEESTEEEEIPPKKKSPVGNPKPTTTTTQKPQSSSESIDGSDSETDSGKAPNSPTASDFTVKPIASKPMDDPSKPKKPNSKPTDPTTIPSRKRPAETEKNGKDRRKEKASNGDVEDGHVEEKKGAINRVWSEADEIVILKGIVDYWWEKGSDPYADMGAFHAFIKGSLHVDVSKNQLTDKVRRLKKKYQTNADKGGNGEDPVFSKPHEYKLFDLSKKIWRDDSVNKRDSSQAKKNGGKSNDKALAKPKEEAKATVLREVVKDEDEIKVKEEDFLSMYPHWNAALESEQSPYLSLSKGGSILVKEYVSLIGVAKAKEMDEKWKALQVEEMKLYSKRVELINEQTKRVLDAMKSSKS